MKLTKSESLQAIDKRLPDYDKPNCNVYVFKNTLWLWYYGQLIEIATNINPDKHGPLQFDLDSIKENCDKIILKP